MCAKRRKIRNHFHASQLRKAHKALLSKVSSQQITRQQPKREQIIIIVAQAAIFSQSVTEQGFKLC